MTPTFIVTGGRGGRRTSGGSTSIPFCIIEFKALDTYTGK